MSKRHTENLIAGTSGMLPPLIVASWLALGLAVPAPGQLPLPAADKGDQGDQGLAQPTVEQIDARRKELRERLAKLRPLAQRAAPEEAATLGQEIELVERVDRLLALQLGELRRAGEVEVGDEVPAGGAHARFGHPPPYSVTELDTVLEELEAAVGRRELSDQAHLDSLRQMERASEQLNERGHEERLARDQLSGTGPEPETLRPLTLEVEAAREQLRLRRLELRAAERELASLQASEERLKKLAGEVRDLLAPTAKELESILAQVTARTHQLDKELADARRQTGAAEEHWSAVQDRIELAADPGAVLVAQATARRLELATAESREELLQKQLLRAGQLQDLWRLRFQTFGLVAPPGSAVRTAADLADRLDSLGRERRLAEARLDERRLSLDVVAQRLAGERLAGERLAAGERHWLEEQGRALQAIVELYEGELTDLDGAMRLARRVQAEIEERHSRIDLGERLGLLRDQVRSAWSAEIVEADDGNPITVGKVITALLLILVGYLISRWLSRRLGRSILPRFGLAHGAAVAFQTLAFYAFFGFFFFWALRVVNIPLTVFTFLGGVLAIGIGFGSQNIMNNFISGLIILAEHPIKVGDLVDVDGVFGQVERIGPRSSRIRAGDNTHVIVPNSAFLEKNVLNWTVSDDVIRTYVDVGVAYGSPVEEVAALLRQAIAEEPGILEDPLPEVLFMDFGDNALAFRAYFWVRVAGSLDRSRHQSRLRFRIDRIFHQAEIVIAYPQRDVHLDSLSPLQVRLLGGPPESSPP